MKNLFLIIIFIVCYGTGKAQGTPIIKLYYVNLNIMTPMDINCDAFKLLFKYEIKKVIINNKKDIDSLIILLNNLQVNKSKYIPDVRAELELFNNNKSKLFCLDKWGLYSEGKSYFLPDKLLKILKRYMKYVELSPKPKSSK